MKTGSRFKCRRCDRPVRPRSPHFPFCSRRCRLLDLGKWFEGDYRVASDERADEEADEPDLG